MTAVAECSGVASQTIAIKRPASKVKLLLAGLFVLIVLLAGAFLVAREWRSVEQALAQADWRFAVLALTATAISHSAISYGYAVVNQLFGVPLRKRDLFEIGFVSVALNHVINVGGLAGLSLRVLLMRKRGFLVGDVLAPSFFYTYFSNLVMFSLFPIGFINILFSEQLSQRQIVVAAVAIGFLLLVLALATALVFVQQMRVIIFRALWEVSGKVTRRDISAHLGEIDAAFARGVTAVRERPRLLLMPLLLILVEWCATLLTLELCFAAFGMPLNPGVLVTGFVVGLVLGFLSMAPGGIGVQEGTMAGTYALMGVPLGQAILAAIVFRVVQYLIPFGVSLPFYLRLLRERKSPP